MARLAGVERGDDRSWPFDKFLLEVDGGIIDPELALDFAVVPSSGPVNQHDIQIAQVR